jgi:hypothetical protein
MEEQKVSVPYIVHEGDMARLERTNKRLWILSILLVVLLVGSNAGWIWYESQFEDVVTTTETYQDVLQDADNGSNTFVGGDYYGEAESQDED